MQNHLTESKVLGMLVGGAIGDALGLPVETWTAEKIKEVYPDGLHEYVQAKGHKYVPDDMPKGSVSDDTQLTLATLKALTNNPSGGEENYSMFMDQIALEHIAAAKESTAGWGKSTLEAVRRLQNNVHWKVSGHTTESNRGTGNGICMKCSPLALLAVLDKMPEERLGESSIELWINFAAMTHYNKMAARSGFIHTLAMVLCLCSDPEDFSQFAFGWMVGGGLISFEDRFDAFSLHLEEPKDDLQSRLKIIEKNAETFKDWSPSKIAETFGNGSCYVYDSLPFSYAWFLKNPHSFDTIRQTAEAGGDTDTNAKMVGELIGAIHGIEFFQTPENRWAIDTLIDYEKIVKLGVQFCHKFDIS